MLFAVAASGLRVSGCRPRAAWLRRAPFLANTQAHIRSFYEDAVASGPNALYLESIYSQWKVDASKVDPKWDEYFRSVEAGEAASVAPSAGAREAALSARMGTAEAALGASSSSVEGAAASKPRKRRQHTTMRVEAEDGGYAVDPIGLKYLIRAFQVRGHEAANLDPLGQHQWRTDRAEPGRARRIPELTPEFHGFTEQDLDQVVTDGNMLWRGSTGGNVGFLSDSGSLGGGQRTLREMVQRISSTYCGSIGIEYMHILDRKRCNWIRQRVECPSFLEADRDQMVRTYERLCAADGFERFLGDKYKRTKRFGIDGGETVIPGLQALVDRAVQMGCEEFVVGMPHRGRLNVLVNVLGKPMPHMIMEFMGTAVDVDAMLTDFEKNDWSTAGDVKYHLGTSNVRKYPTGETVTLTLEANPSHLETVGPVALGRARAKQYYLGNEESTKKRVMPILMHGDASFAGQGVVYESMQLARVDDFDVGGTIHVIVNNQVGFTTDPKNSRSTHYCSDLGKAFSVPIFHCNGDDPIAVVRAFELAAEWRQDWGEDCIVDVICYRRFGHNEGDTPELTQPALYKAINQHRRSEELLAERLLRDGQAEAPELQQIKQSVWDQFERDFEAAQTYKPNQSDWVATKWEGIRRPNEMTQHLPTGVSVELLRKIGVRLCETPDNFTQHSILKRILKAKRQRIEEGDGLDWATAEGLAFGTLLLEGVHVRITGQDVQRGTFAHRHCVVRDQVNSSEYAFLNELNLGPQETFVARNSILSEYAVLGFELGYSYENPNALCIWEAQFGDFVNTAQVMIDQYISAGEHKWLQQSALTMLLPHGYDGQGAEHSSCRLERFLQLCDDDEDDVPDIAEAGSAKQIQKSNLQVMNLSTPANYFHALRQQLRRDFRKPLVVASPKALLRLKHCVSSLEEMGPGSEFQRLIPERNPAIAQNPSQVNRLIFCTGKIYYELLAEREKLGLTNVAIVTVEMIAPFPFDKAKEEMKLYDGVDRGDGVHPGDIIWCQEEPKNMGAWAYVRPRIITVAREALGMDLVMRYVGRRASAAPATGIGKLHTAEQEAIVKEALIGGKLEDGSSRPSALLGHQT
mmetsp:Transcript_57119/g.122876  ORF Transcript_57119/g.122876 Transcript_57119/m.122876 type:complete len:1087 (+) Transcript_57119:110-3370(+)